MTSQFEVKYINHLKPTSILIICPPDYILKTYPSKLLTSFYITIKSGSIMYYSRVVHSLYTKPFDKIQCMDVVKARKVL